MLRTTTYERILERLRENEARLLKMAESPAPGVTPQRIEWALGIIRARIEQASKQKRLAELAGSQPQNREESHAQSI